AAYDFGYKKIVLAGGVSANSLLREQTEKLCRQKNIEVYMPELKYCGDNAAMIGAQAYYEYLSGNTAAADLNAAATKSIEEG
ncbi:MAG: tRNA (adenosine(37)-N6)-threonylcarbamoyltransferase complex transferase subunit TsaD, partial [Clostridia bacterium]|nr:tRNA (adenosine(37)-N6)-threonylcarbamoyltransferase complex transferase subunit TsaD [Clostridia bacterium]